MTLFPDIRCKICNEMRPWNKISVSEIVHNSFFTENIQFCNDNPGCFDKISEEVEKRINKRNGYTKNKNYQTFMELLSTGLDKCGMSDVLDEHRNLWLEIKFHVKTTYEGDVLSSINLYNASVENVYREFSGYTDKLKKPENMVEFKVYSGEEVETKKFERRRNLCSTMIEEFQNPTEIIEFPTNEKE